ncbi:NADPH-dependent F420 reductase [Actinacidiphila sp. bgisy145]|uniref:NADPH-dependent F420 reductase n=1 Tax=Actinacidiphila sp. bgisy145 TaxID=3413792 RepID=UPI003EBCD1FB
MDGREARPPPRLLDTHEERRAGPDPAEPDLSRTTRRRAQRKSPTQEPDARARRREGALTMSSISIIGLGQMARVLANRALDGAHAVEVVGRDAAKAADVAAALGRGATAGTMDAAPAGDIVILAVPAGSAVPVVSRYGDALAGKVVVDISNPFNSAATGVVTPEGTSVAQEIAKAAPASTHVVKAFNTVFGGVLAQGRPVDVFLAGDDARAKARTSAFVESIGLRPWDTGDLAMARWLEGAGVLMMGLGRHGVGAYDFSLGVTTAG